MFITNLMGAMGALGDDESTTDLKPKQSLADTMKAAKAESEHKEVKTKERVLRNIGEREAVIRAELDDHERLKKELQQILDDKKELGIAVTEETEVRCNLGALLACALQERIRSVFFEVYTHSCVL
jgi:hypothetical protein